MKHIYHLAVCAALSAVGLAAWGAPPQLAVLGGDGSTKAVHPVAQVERVTFSGGTVTVANAGGEASAYPTGGLSRIVFDSDGAYAVDAVAEAMMAGAAVTPNPVTDSFAVTGCDAGPLEVYSLDGGCVMRIAAYDGSAVDASALAPGIYIVKTTSITAKLIKL